MLEPVVLYQNEHKKVSNANHFKKVDFGQNVTENATNVHDGKTVKESAREAEHPRVAGALC